LLAIVSGTSEIRVGKIRMKLFGFARTSRDVRAVVQTLRDHGIKVTGPYRTPKGTTIFTLADAIVTERELLELAIAGKLDASGISKFISKIMKYGSA
jgi:hypothetical protein